MILGGTKECLVPIDEIWGDRTIILGGTIDLEFEGTKQGFWGDQTMIFGGPKSVLNLKVSPIFISWSI